MTSVLQLLMVGGLAEAIGGHPQTDGEDHKAPADQLLHGFSSSASASVMATEDRTTEAVARKATTNDPANASFFLMGSPLARVGRT